MRGEDKREKGGFHAGEEEEAVKSAGLESGQSEVLRKLSAEEARLWLEAWEATHYEEGAQLRWGGAGGWPRGVGLKEAGGFLRLPCSWCGPRPALTKALPPAWGLGSSPAQWRSPPRKCKSACPELRALSRAALSRELARQRSRRGLAGARVGAALRLSGRERVCAEAPTAHRDLSAGVGSGPCRPACSGWGRRAWTLGDPAPTAAASPQPHRMEILDEFDSEFPQSVTFCQRISEEAFERQAATYTERALRRLFRSLDRNPALAERVVRKDKQAECERRGLLSFLWAKFFCAVQGELNFCNSMGALEMHQRLEHLKRSIHRVHLYSQKARKKRRKPKVKKLEPVLLRNQSTSPCLPPTLLPPPPLPPPATTMSSVVVQSSPSVYTMPRVFGPFPPLPSKSTEKLEVSSSEVKLNWPGLSSNPKSHMVNLTPLVLSPGGFHFSYLPRNGVHKLHYPGFPWTSACNDSPNTEETPAPPVETPVFTPPVLLKFQPVPRPRDDSETDHGSAQSVPHKRGA